MYKKILISLLMVSSAIASNNSLKELEVPTPLLSERAALLSSVDESYWEKSLQEVHCPDRYFTLEAQTSTPILEQFIDQATKFLTVRQTYMQDQADFLQSLNQKAQELNYTKIQELHPWLKEQKDEKIKNLISGNMLNYQNNVQNIENFITLLRSPDSTINSLFIKIVQSRIHSIASRLDRRENGVFLPSTKASDFHNLADYDKSVTLEAITNFRLFDEMLVTLFPYISAETLTKANQLTHEETLIQQDYALMQFLAGQINVPLDPDTTIELRTLEGKPKKIFLSDSRKFTSMIMPILPLTYKNLYNKLLESLPLEKKPGIDTSFIPAHILQFEKQKRKAQEALQRKNAQKKRTVETSEPTPVDVQTRQENQLIKMPVSVETKNPLNSPEERLSSPSSPSLTASPKPIKPQGGWNIKDQQRSIEATKKKGNMIASASPSTPSQKLTQFSPTEPITLTGGQYKTLQSILDPNIPAYSFTFDQVKDLLEGIGIKVTRKGGSHTHIDTPGNNMKILVDIHYGWTDKYGPGTMKNLRQLMVNLGLNLKENIKIQQ